MSKKFIFKDRNNKSTEILNPYIKGSEGKKQWNDRYMNMAKSIRNWQLALSGSVIISVILAIAIGKMATESRIQPVAVEVCNGEPKGFLPVTANIPNSDKIVQYAINQFITNARTVYSDAQAEKALLDKVYAFSAGNTVSFFHDYYIANNPFTIAAQSTVEVDNVNSMQISPNTWQITWDETKKSVTGDEVISKDRWMATVTTQYGPVQPKFMNDNPFGIYITQISWSQIQTQ